MLARHFRHADAAFACHAAAAISLRAILSLFHADCRHFRRCEACRVGQ
jgi:hypothetical protein